MAGFSYRLLLPPSPLNALYLCCQDLQKASFPPQRTTPRRRWACFLSSRKCCMVSTWCPRVALRTPRNPTAPVLGCASGASSRLNFVQNMPIRYSITYRRYNCVVRSAKHLFLCPNECSTLNLYQLRFQREFLADRVFKVLMLHTQVYVRMWSFWPSLLQHFPLPILGALLHTGSKRSADRVDREPTQ